MSHVAIAVLLLMLVNRLRWFELAMASCRTKSLGAAFAHVLRGLQASLISMPLIPVMEIVMPISSLCSTVLVKIVTVISLHSPGKHVDAAMLRVLNDFEDDLLATRSSVGDSRRVSWKKQLRW